MLLVNTEASGFVLLLNETPSVSLEVFRILPCCTEGKNSPSSGIRSKFLPRQVCNTSFGQRTSGQLLANHSLKRSRGHMSSSY